MLKYLYVLSCKFFHWVCFLFCVLTTTAQSTSSLPNIIWITTEDMSPRLGCYGDSLAQTPHIDQLAKEGQLYTQAFSISGVCSPSRSALITGCYPTSIGTLHHRTTTKNNPYCEPYVAVPPAEVKGFPEYLRAAGYYCTNNSKTDYQFGLPFTIWDENGTDAHWKNRPHSDQPFFAVFNSTATHESKLFRKETIEDQVKKWEAEGRSTAYLRKQLEWNPEKVVSPEAVNLPPYYPNHVTFKEDVAQMYDNIHAMDGWVGKHLAALEEAGLLENTIVFFFSDHGTCLPRGKRWLYDTGIQVPLIIRWPGKLEAGTRTHRMVSFVDFGPTVLSLAHVEVPAHMQGIPFLGDQEGAERQYIYAARDRTDELLDQIRAVRDSQFKYIKNLSADIPYSYPLSYAEMISSNPAWRKLHEENQLKGPARDWFNQKPKEELYDIKSDPHEVHNLAKDPQYAEVLDSLRIALAEWREETQDMGEIDEAQIRQSMYPNGKQPVSPSPEIKMENNSWVLTVAQQASIGYRWRGESNDQWKLYVGPIPVEEESIIEAKAIKYGCKESDMVSSENFSSGKGNRN